MNSDLIVAGRGAEHDITNRAVIEAALLTSGRPLLIPGGAPGTAVIGGTAAIAWKATPQCARAVAAALPFLARTQDIRVLTVEESEGAQGADRLVRYLAWHGLRRVSAELLHPADRDPIETLLAAASESTGLLVMGGYGHSRVREWVFGGFTRRVLANAPLPVLIAH
jgi:nucleotide-binding universal stress UspA family protein